MIKTFVPAARTADPKLLASCPEQAEEELRCFFAGTLDLLCLAGLDGYFKRLNPVWETTLGWTIEELQGRPFIEFVHPGDRAATLSELDRLGEGARTIQFENRYRCKDGSHKWLQWNATSLCSQRQIAAIARDVTLRRGLENQMIETGDREKERLGRELHDGLCQNLAGIAALSTTLSRKLAADSKSAADEAGEITRLLNETIGHARDMARGLNPVNLERIGIAAALGSHAANVEALFQVSCGFLCRQPDRILGADVEAHLFRIAQEAVSNAITHGRAKRIEISLSFQDGNGRLSIQDDGVGITGKALTGQGAGMHTMDYRARLIGGALEVRARSRRGTKVICTFPLPPALEND